MARLFSYPNAETWQLLVEHGLVDGAWSPRCGRGRLPGRLRAGPGCSAGAAVRRHAPRRGRTREGILEDLLRFYEFFDVKLSDRDREYPDHLVTELEFLAWLSRQSRPPARTAAMPRRSSCRTTSVDRHLAAWLPAFADKLAATATIYARYGTTLRELVEAHRNSLDEQLQESGETA